LKHQIKLQKSNLNVLIYFQFVLTIIGDKAAPEFRSGSLNLERKIMSGKQDYDIDPKEWPVNQPTIKVEARAQCSGRFLFLYLTLVVFELIIFRIHFR
jgi:hypothetical protein